VNDLTEKEFQKFMIEHMTKMSDDISDLRQNMMRMEFQLTEKINILFDGQDSITKKLDEHTGILNKHSEILGEHTEILNKHSEILDDHTERLQRIEDKVEHHDIRIKVLDETKSNKRKATK